MTPDEIARTIDYLRSFPGDQPTASTAGAMLFSLADLVTDRERLLDAWKEVMRRSPLGTASRELTEATVALMRAEEDVRRAIGYTEAGR